MSLKWKENIVKQQLNPPEEISKHLSTMQHNFDIRIQTFQWSVVAFLSGFVPQEYCMDVSVFTL